MGKEGEGNENRAVEVKSGWVDYGGHVPYRTVPYRKQTLDDGDVVMVNFGNVVRWV